MQPLRTELGTSVTRDVCGTALLVGRSTFPAPLRMLAARHTALWWRLSLSVAWTWETFWNFLLMNVVSLGMWPSVGISISPLSDLDVFAVYDPRRVQVRAFQPLYQNQWFRNIEELSVQEQRPQHPWMHSYPIGFHERHPKPTGKGKVKGLLSLFVIIMIALMWKRPLQHRLQSFMVVLLRGMKRFDQQLASFLEPNGKRCEMAVASFLAPGS